MITSLRLKLKDLSWNNRTLRNIFSIIVLRGGNIAIQLLIIPVSIKYVSASSYGLWLTLSSMISWLNIMDIGLSAGLRNKLTEAIALKDKKLGKSYVSTTYALLFFMSLAGILICIGLIYLLDWRSILEIPKDLTIEQFRLLLFIIAVSFFVTFLLKPIASVAYALHRPAIEYFILFFSNFINLGLIWCLTKLQPTGDIITMASMFCFTPIIVTLILSLILYRGVFRQYHPSLETVNFKYTKALTGLSLKFFIIQISATVVFTTNNFMISHFFGNEDVTKYNIVSKYFNVIIILQSMILVPFWTYFTEAFVKKDKEWLKSIMSKLLGMACLFSLASIVMALISSLVYRMWLGSIIEVPIQLTVVVCVFTICSVFAAVFSTFLNGTGRIKFQMYTSLIPIMFHIPLTIFVVKWLNLGIIGVLSVSCFWLIVTLPLRYIQYRKIISFKHDSGIWVS